jgi:hypothetical protein
VCTSDDLAATISELQLDLGVGPCWDAYSTRTAVLAPDLAALPQNTWPLLRRSLAAWNVRAVYSFPLTVGRLRIGAVDLYSESTEALSSADVADAAALADRAATDVMRSALAHRHDEPEADGPYSRREVHQATGMVIAQLGIGAADALLLIRAHSYASGRSVRDTAAEITSRRIVLEP